MEAPLSRLVQFSKTQNWFKFLGDTLYFRNENGRAKMKFRFWPFFILLIFAAIAMGYMLYFLFAITVIHGISMSEMIDKANEFNMGYTDMISMNAFVTLRNLLWDLQFKVGCPYLQFQR